MTAVFIAAVVVGFCVAAGRRLLAWLGFHPAHLSESLAYSATVGLGLCAYLILAVGLLGALNALGFAAVGLVICALAILQVVRRRTRRRATRRAVRTSKLLPGGKVLLGLLGLMAFFPLVSALAPPDAEEYDSLTYHLAAPKVYLAHQRIIYLPYDHHSNFPFTWEMLYALGLFLHGPQVAKLFSYAAWVLCGIAVFAVGQRYFGSTGGLAGAAAFMSIPFAAWEAGTAYIDVAHSLCLLLGVFGALVWWQERESGWLWAGAIAFGLGMGTKTTGLIAFATVAVLLFGAVLFAPSFGRHDKPAGAGTSDSPRAAPSNRWARAKPVVAFCLIAAVVGSPWYVKSYVWTGNPVYPFYYRIFGGRQWSQPQAAMLEESVHRFGIGHEWGKLFLTPAAVAFHGDKFADRPSPRNTTGPLFWLLLPPLVLFRRVGRVEVALGLVAVCYWVAWFSLTQYLRYLLPALAVLSPLAGAGVEACAERRAWLGRLAQGCVIATVAVSAAMLFLIAAPQWPVVSGAQSQADYLASAVAYLPSYPAMVYLNHQAPPGSKVALYGEPRGYYLDMDYIYAEAGHNRLIDYPAVHTAAGLLAQMRKLGITHILVSEPEWPEAREGSTDFGRAFQQALQQGALVETFRTPHPGAPDEAVVVYKVAR